MQTLLVSCISIGRMPVSERLLSRARMALCGGLSFLGRMPVSERLLSRARMALCGSLSFIGRMPVSERLLSRAHMALCGDLSFTKPPGTLHKQQSNNQVNIYESKNTE